MEEEEEKLCATEVEKKKALSQPFPTFLPFWMLLCRLPFLFEFVVDSASVLLLRRRRRRYLFHLFVGYLFSYLSNFDGEKETWSIERKAAFFASRK